MLLEPTWDVKSYNMSAQESFQYTLVHGCTLSMWDKAVIQLTVKSFMLAALTSRTSCLQHWHQELHAYSIDIIQDPTDNERARGLATRNHSSQAHASKIYIHTVQLGTYINTYSLCYHELSVNKLSWTTLRLFQINNVSQSIAANSENVHRCSWTCSY